MGGIITFVLSTFNFRLIIFHIVFHAFSKAIIFKSTGICIHIYNNFQDFRNLLSSILSQINFNKIFIFVGSLSLIRIFGFICFYSKDTILFLSFAVLKDSFSLLIFILSSLYTVLYSVKFFKYFYNNFSFNFYTIFINFGTNKVFINFVSFTLILQSFNYITGYTLLTLNISSFEILLLGLFTFILI